MQDSDKHYRTKIDASTGKITLSFSKPVMKHKVKSERKKNTCYNFKKFSNKEGVLRN